MGVEIPSSIQNSVDNITKTGGDGSILVENWDKLDRLTQITIYGYFTLSARRNGLQCEVTDMVDSKGRHCHFRFWRDDHDKDVSGVDRVPPIHTR